MLVRVKTLLASSKKLVNLYKLYKYNRLRVLRNSPFENIYHCCTQRTASQWFKALFSDYTVYKYTGLKVFPFNQIVKLRDARFDDPFPKRTIGANMYIDYSVYATIPKPPNYRTFFILRDPRDIVVSWYFSIRYSHAVVIDSIAEVRKLLEKLSVSEGLKYSIDILEEAGLFRAQKSWMHVSSEDQKNIRIFRYEDFVRDERPFLKQLFDYMDIAMPEKEFISLYERHRFENYSEGRKKGVEDQKSHYRKGESGDWVNYFNDSILGHFLRVTEDLLKVLGYER